MLEKNCKTWLAGLMLAVGLVGASWAQVAEEAGEAEQIQATLTAMWAAIEAGDLQEYARYVHPDFTQFGENDVYLSSGKERELRSMADYLGRARNVHTEMHQPQVTVRGDVAWITYYWTDSGEIEDRRFTSRGKSTRIFVKEDGRWLCIHGHYTAVP